MFTLNVYKKGCVKPIQLQFVHYRDLVKFANGLKNSETIKELSYENLLNKEEILKNE